jgi:predicted NBD/HSP70 family sugar kinase
LFDAKTGKLRFSVVIPPDEMTYTDIVEVLKERFQKTIVMISNNGGVIAFSEFIVEGEDVDIPLLSVNIDEGISGGMVLNEPRSETRMCFPLEIGHIIVDNDGPECKCGNRGCLETLCSTSALFRSLNEKASLGLTFRDTFGAECNQVAMEITAEHFKAKDPRVMPVIEDYVYTLCSGLVSTVNLCNIKCIHIGGSISMLGQGFADLVCKTLKERFVPLNSSLEFSLVLFSNDFERIRRAAAHMTMFELFKNV